MPTSRSPKPEYSLKHEYELYVEREIEDYKDSVPRSALLSIGDEAVAALRAQAQTTLTEMVLWEEVDRIIARRLRLPSYATWRRRRLKLLAEFRRPEHWGLSPSSALARELGAPAPAGGGHVLLAGVPGEGTALYSAAHGCSVTALDRGEDALERVMHAAEAVGLTRLVRGCVADLGEWSPDVALRVVVCAPAALERLTPAERARVIDTLQGATLDGGVHLVQTLVDAERRASLDAAACDTLSLDELHRRYDGWAVTIEGESAGTRTFLARKGAALN
jgi:hypothetical protein